MPIAPYGGLILAGLAAMGGALNNEVYARPVQGQAVQELVSGQETRIGSMAAFCTDAATAGAQTNYTLHVAAANSEGAFLKNAVVDVAAPDGTHLRLQCSDDWLLLRAPVGTYQLITATAHEERSETVDVPAYGRVRVAVSFAHG